MLLRSRSLEARSDGGFPKWLRLQPNHHKDVRLKPQLRSPAELQASKIDKPAVVASMQTHDSHGIGFTGWIGGGAALGWELSAKE